VRETGECGHDASQPFGLGRGVEAKSDLVGQLELDAMERRLATFGWMGVEVERNEQGRLRPSGQSSLPGLEGGTGDAFTCAEGGDGQATGGLPLEALSPGAFEVEVFRACHELTPGLVKGDQPSRIAAVARLVLPGAYR
jgi:hypothetical protein